MHHSLTFLCESLNVDGTSIRRPLAVTPSALVIAGWTGRNQVAIEHHIAELHALGVARPSAVPLYYRGAASLLTQVDVVQALGSESSGEVEPVLFFADGEWWLTVGSDHTDREVEAYSVAVSKQMCPKPVASLAWRWSEVEAHQDLLELSSRVFENGGWVDYQKGTLQSIRPLARLRDQAFGSDPAAHQPGAFLSCGTLAALPGANGRAIRPAESMEMTLHDPVYGRTIVHRYQVEPLPVVA